MFKEKSDLSKEEQQAHEAQYGKYNDFPPGWQEITEAQFAQSHFFTYAPRLIEFRQMTNPLWPLQTAPAVQAHLQFMHDHTGYAIVSEFWGKKIHFFKFGCQHEFVDAAAELKRRQIKLFSQQHASYCPKCGFLGITDSSD